jgi:OmpA family
MKFLLKTLVLICLSAIGLQAHSLSPVKVTYSADALFPHQDEKNINPEHLSELDNLASKIKKINLEVVIAVGHADPSEKNALSLSKSRAELVKQYLVKAGVDASRIYTEGQGSTRPLGKDASRNRRVEIEVVGTPSLQRLTWEELKAEPLTWRLLDDSVKHISNTPRPTLPPPWSARNRDALPILEFVQTIQDPAWREIYAHKLLIEAIWRKDDSLAIVAFELREKVQILLDKNKHSSSLYGYPVASLEAASYGTPIAKGLTIGELQNYKDAHSLKADQLKKVICQQPPYGVKNSQDIIDAGKALYPGETFMPKFEPTLQYALLGCALSSYPIAFQWLIEQGGNPDLTNTLGQTMLHLDILWDGGRNMERLIKAKTNINATDYQSNTALHFIAKSQFGGGAMLPPISLSIASKQQLWDTLIAAGANPNIPNKAGQLPVRP